MYSGFAKFRSSSSDPFEYTHLARENTPNPYQLEKTGRQFTTYTVHSPILSTQSWRVRTTFNKKDEEIGIHDVEFECASEDTTLNTKGVKIILNYLNSDNSISHITLHNDSYKVQQSTSRFYVWYDLFNCWIDTISSRRQSI